MTKTLVVSGASGFIGSKFVNVLNGDYKQYRIKAIVRPTSDVHRIPKDVEIHPGNLDDFSFLVSCVQEADVVVHFAAEMDFYPKNVQNLYRVNVEGTRNLVKACLNSHRVKRFIYCSTTETIGATQGVADEETTCNPIYEYGKSKVLAEEVVRNELKGTNIDYVILRPTGVFGKEDFFTIFELMQMVELGLLFFIPGSGQAKLMYTYVDDVVEAFILALDSEKCANQTIIVCPDEPLSYQEWISVLSQELNRAIPRISLPFPLVKAVVSIIGPIMNLGKKRTFMYQTPTIERMKEDRVYSNSKAKSLLNFHAKYSIAQGLRETVRYNIEKGYLHKTPLSPFCAVLLLLFLLFLLFYAL